MIHSYKNDEFGYDDWLLNNRQGFVFNYCYTPTLNKLHRANCSFLNRVKDLGSRTTFEKLCSVTYVELEHKVEELCGHNGWSKCGHCFK